LLKEKGEDFSKQNLASLDTILAPLRERIKDFEKKVDDTHKEGSAQHIALKTQIEGLLGMNQRLSAEAQSLTLALKGENKKGGNWGEMVLERVLEGSGLEKGREYRIQPSFAGEDGTQRPDVVIDLPDNRHLVVDSKLSLVAYERYCAATDSATAESELDAHVQSIRLHIDQLSAKKYQDLHALNSVDFVFLFMPVEPAFIEASKRDPSLFQTAFAKNIVIVSPSTLLATLRTVASIWKQEHQNRNVREIARQATALYDKFVGFIADLDKVGKALGVAQETFGEAKAKLSQGKGNLVTRVENLTKLGVKSGKVIPPAWRDADADDGSDEAPLLIVDEPTA
jgi:DNA recombination protein RmuC